MTATAIPHPDQGPAMEAPAVVAGESAPSDRHRALQAAAAAIRVRRGSRIPVEQILLAAAAVLFPLGLVFVLLGWEGASHTGRTYAQLDYLISGGLFGLGLSVAGGFMYFGYWLSRQLTESRRQNAQTLQALNRLEDLLSASLASRVGHNGAVPVPPTNEGPARGGRRSSGGRAASGPVLYATPRGNLLHRPECPVVARRDDLRSVTAGTDGFGYCTMCEAAGVLGR